MRTVNAVTWFEIYVDDMDRARKFYETVLGEEMIPMPMPEGFSGQMVTFPWVEGATNSSGALVQDETRKDCKRACRILLRVSSRIRYL